MFGKKCLERRLDAVVVNGAGHRLPDIPGFLALLHEMLVDPAVVARRKRSLVFRLIVRWLIPLIEFLRPIELPLPAQLVWYATQPLTQSVHIVNDVP